MADPEGLAALILLRREIERLQSPGDLLPRDRDALLRHIDEAIGEIERAAGGDAVRKAVLSALLTLAGRPEVISPGTLADLVNRFEDPDCRAVVSRGALVRVRKIAPPPLGVAAAAATGAPEAAAAAATGAAESALAGEPAPAAPAEAPLHAVIDLAARRAASRAPPAAVEAPGPPAEARPEPVPEAAPREPARPWRPSRVTIYVALQICGALLTIAGSLPLVISSWSSLAVKTFWFVLVGGVFYGIGLWAERQLGRPQGNVHIVTRVWLTIFLVLVPLLLAVPDTLKAPFPIRLGVLLLVGAAAIDAGRRLGVAPRSYAAEVAAFLGLGACQLFEEAVAGRFGPDGLEVLVAASAAALVVGVVHAVRVEGERAASAETLFLFGVLGFAYLLVVTRSVILGLGVVALSPGLAIPAILLHPLGRLLGRSEIPERRTAGTVLVVASYVGVGVALLVGTADARYLLVTDLVAGGVAAWRAYREKDVALARLALALHAVLWYVAASVIENGWGAPLVALLRRPVALGTLLAPLPLVYVAAAWALRRVRETAFDATVAALAAAAIPLVCLAPFPHAFGAAALAFGGAIGIASLLPGQASFAYVALALIAAAAFPGYPFLAYGSARWAAVLGGVGLAYAAGGRLTQGADRPAGSIAAPFDHAAAAIAILTPCLLPWSGGLSGTAALGLAAGSGTWLLLHRSRARGSSAARPAVSYLALAYGSLAAVTAYAIVRGGGSTLPWWTLARWPEAVTGTALVLAAAAALRKRVPALPELSAEAFAWTAVALCVAAVPCLAVAGVLPRSATAIVLAAGALSLSAAALRRSEPAYGAAVAAVAAGLFVRGSIARAYGVTGPALLLDAPAVAAGAACALAAAGRALATRPGLGSEIFAAPAVHVAACAALATPFLFLAGPGIAWPAILAAALGTGTWLLVLRSEVRGLPETRPVVSGLATGYLSFAVVLAYTFLRASGPVAPWWTLLQWPEAPTGVALLLAGAALCARRVRWLEAIGPATLAGAVVLLCGAAAPCAGVAGIVPRSAVAAALATSALALAAAAIESGTPTYGAAVAALAAGLLVRGCSADATDPEQLLDAPQVAAGVALALVAVGTAVRLRAARWEAIFGRPPIVAALAFATLWAGILLAIYGRVPEEAALLGCALFSLVFAIALPAVPHAATTLAFAAYATAAALIAHHIYRTSAGPFPPAWTGIPALIQEWPTSSLLGVAIAFVAGSYVANSMERLKPLRGAIVGPLSYTAVFYGFIVAFRLAIAPLFSIEPLLFAFYALGVSAVLCGVAWVRSNVRWTYPAFVLLAAGAAAFAGGVAPVGREVEWGALTVPLSAAAAYLVGRNLGAFVGLRDRAEFFEGLARAARWFAAIVLAATSILGWFYANDLHHAEVERLIEPAYALFVIAGALLAGIYLLVRDDPIPGLVAAHVSGFALLLLGAWAADILGPEAAPLVTAYAVLWTVIHRQREPLLRVVFAGRDEAYDRAKALLPGFTALLIEATLVLAILGALGDPRSLSSIGTVAAAAGTLYALFLAEEQHAALRLGSALAVLHLALALYGFRWEGRLGPLALGTVAAGAAIAFVATGGLLDAREGLRRRLLRGVPTEFLVRAGAVDAAIALTFLVVYLEAVPPVGTPGGEALLGFADILAVTALVVILAIRNDEEWIVYLAEACLVFGGVFVRITLPSLFQHQIFRRFWPFFLVGASFAALGGSRALAGRGRRSYAIIERPLYRTALVLTIPAFLGAFTLASYGLTALVCVLVAAFFWTLAVLERRAIWGALAAITANVAFYPFLLWFDLDFAAHAEIYLAPAGLSLLLAADVRPDLVPAAHRPLLRWAGASLILASLGWVIRTDDYLRTQETLLLAAVSTAFVGLGLRLRARSFVISGSAFLLLDLINVVYLVWKEQYLSLGVLAVITGFTIVAVSSYLFTRWERVERFIGEVKRWE